jgi:hypothetical protein
MVAPPRSLSGSPLRASTATPYVALVLKLHHATNSADARVETHKTNTRMARCERFMTHILPKRAVFGESDSRLG